MSYQHVVSSDHDHGSNESPGTESTPVGVWQVVFTNPGKADDVPRTILVLARSAQDAVAVGESVIPQQSDTYGWESISAKHIRADQGPLAAPDVTLMSVSEYLARVYGI